MLFLPKKIVVTAFKPFLNAQYNVSEILAQKLFEEGVIPKPLLLPVEFKKSFEILKSQIILDKPDVVVMLGQAADRKKISFEKIAHNWQYSKYPDESGVIPTTGPLVEKADLAIMTSCDLEAVVQNYKADRPVEVSFSAGTFVCNDLYYRVLHEFKEIDACFIHLPLLPLQAEGQDQFSLSEQVQLQTLKEFFVRGIDQI